MILKPIAKPVRIRIKSGGMEHSSIESLKAHFVLDDLKPLIHDGRLSRWLEQQNQKAIPEDLIMLDMESPEFEVALYKFFFNQNGAMSESEFYFLVYQKTQKIVHLVSAAMNGNKDAEVILKERKKRNEKAEKIFKEGQKRDKPINRAVSTDDVNNKNSSGYNISKVAKEFNVGVNTINEYLAKSGKPLQHLSPRTRISASQYDIIAKAFRKEVEPSRSRVDRHHQESKQKDIHEGKFLVGEEKYVYVVYNGYVLVDDNLFKAILGKYDGARLLKKRELEYIIRHHQIIPNSNGWSVLPESLDSNLAIRIPQNNIWAQGVHSKHVYECYLNSDINLRRVREVPTNGGIMVLVRDLE